MITRLLAPAVTALFVTTLAAPTPASAQTAAQHVALASDSTFLQTAGSLGLLQVKLGKLAQQKGSSDVVRDFGKRMAAEYSQTNEQLAAGAKQHWGATPDRVKKLVNLFADEHYACMEYTTEGTLTGRVDFGSVAIPPTGLKYELQVCFVFHLKDGKIDRVREYFDMETVRRFPGMAEAAAKAKAQRP